MCAHKRRPVGFYYCLLLSLMMPALFPSHHFESWYFLLGWRTVNTVWNVFFIPCFPHSLASSCTLSLLHSAPVSFLWPFRCFSVIPRGSALCQVRLRAKIVHSPNSCFICVQVLVWVKMFQPLQSLLHVMNSFGNKFTAQNLDSHYLIFNLFRIWVENQKDYIRLI